MLSPWEKVVFSVIILLTIGAFVYPVYLRLQILRRGRPEERGDGLFRRLGDTLAKVFLQKCTLKNERVFTGFMHVFIFYGALTFDTMTVNHTLEGYFDKFYLFGDTGFGLFFSLIVDVFAILVLVGVGFFAIRRFLLRPKAYQTTPFDSGLIYIFLIIVTLSYLYFEAFAIASHPESVRLSFLGKFLSAGLTGRVPGTLAAHFKISWWLHILVVFGFIAYVPHSKYFHMFTGPVNVYFRAPGSSRELRPIDIEKAEVFGTEKATDLTWKDFLDAFACMECGRCQDACPAFASGKPLSPKMLIFNLEKHLLGQRRNLVPAKRDDLPSLFPDVHGEGEIWTCTTCGACQHVCPVEIEHIRKIVGVRQSEVLMQSRFPQELNAFFRNLESNSNPWGIGFAKRADWAAGLDVPVMAERGSAEYLLWVGCAGSFDEEGTEIAKAMVTILKKAGFDFAILGTEEKCCGDSARRLGQEYLFQTLAAENIALFNRYQVRKIITFCPHGYNTFKNEYPKLRGLLSGVPEKDQARLAEIEVIPHLILIQQLLKDGRLPLRPKGALRLTYHDSCYFGRHNGIVAEPRQIIAALAPEAFRELKNNRQHSFCCGAGGGLMWTEEKLGQRINHLRTDEVIAAGAEVTATSCPFCLNMLKDGLKDKDKADIKVKDLAQLVVESLA
ncbi:MAG TPA: heterodisulfide reductase-related iron-sulfur binding cluster [Candidatus Desulfaltia sp.]|nr:heterodisulfide reductase-related iron-sulfur binding cluster [Candidatus Desulfaltia sp.]